MRKTICLINLKICLPINIEGWNNASSKPSSSMPLVNDHLLSVDHLLDGAQNLLNTTLNEIHEHDDAREHQTSLHARIHFRRLSICLTELFDKLRFNRRSISSDAVQRYNKTENASIEKRNESFRSILEIVGK